MTDRLMDIVAEQLRHAGARTADCPTLVFRVTAGVDRRRRRRWSVAAGAAIIAVAVAGPVLREGPRPQSGTSLQASNSCVGLAPAACARISAARANLALRRANPADPTIVQPVGDEPSCLHRLYCRGPV